jgi:hypothetical protein
LVQTCILRNTAEQGDCPSRIGRWRFCWY